MFLLSPFSLSTPLPSSPPLLPPPTLSVPPRLSSLSPCFVAPELLSPLCKHESNNHDGNKTNRSPESFPNPRCRGGEGLYLFAFHPPTQSSAKKKPLLGIRICCCVSAWCVCLSAVLHPWVGVGNPGGALRAPLGYSPPYHPPPGPTATSPLYNHFPFPVLIL